APFLLFFTRPAPTETYTLPLHDALPIWARVRPAAGRRRAGTAPQLPVPRLGHPAHRADLRHQPRVRRRSAARAGHAGADRAAGAGARLVLRGARPRGGTRRRGLTDTRPTAPGYGDRTPARRLPCPVADGLG